MKPPRQQADIDNKKEGFILAKGEASFGKKEI